MKKFLICLSLALMGCSKLHRQVPKYCIRVPSSMQSSGWIGEDADSYKIKDGCVYFITESGDSIIAKDFSITTNIK